MMTFLLTIILLFALVWSAFCSGSETGFLSVSRGRVLHLAHAGSKAAKILHAALSDMGYTTTALLVGNNLANVTCSTVSAVLASRIFPNEVAAQAIWGVIVASGMLYFCEFLPKLFASARPLRRMLGIARVWRIFEMLIRPLAKTALAVTELFVPHREKSVRKSLSPDEMLRVLRDRKDGVCLTEIESALIGRILVLRATNRPVTPESILSSIDDWV